MVAHFAEERDALQQQLAGAKEEARHARGVAAAALTDLAAQRTVVRASRADAAMLRAHQALMEREAA